MVDDDDPDAFSAGTAAALDRSTVALVGELQRLTTTSSSMRGGSADVERVHALGDAVTRALVDWQEAVLRHTGCWVVPLADHAGDPEPEPSPDVRPGEVLGVVTRWDIAVLDPEALLARAREAHRRHQPTETEEDAVAAVPDVASALFELGDQRSGGEFRDVADVEVRGGTRMALAPEEALEWARRQVLVTSGGVTQSVCAEDAVHRDVDAHAPPSTRRSPVRRRRPRA